MHSLIDMMAKQLKKTHNLMPRLLQVSAAAKPLFYKRWCLSSHRHSKHLCPLPCYLDVNFQFSGGEKWKPILEKQVENFGLANRLASVRTVSMTGAEIVNNPDKAYEMIVKLSDTCAQKDGASCVILGELHSQVSLQSFMSE
ncbi:hypothetical protein J4727_12140 [Providencia rettgeri]|uniref:Uncharacterized protein n=1 Tax=Providencia rettgeri TaxID=587 RepID=A0A939SJC9_PRORE|nr:hypothetical protein [Providencia rettgeri]